MAALVLNWDIESSIRQGVASLTIGSYAMTVSLHQPSDIGDVPQWNAQMVDLWDESTDGRNWFGQCWSTNIEDALEEAESWLMGELDHLKISYKKPANALPRFLLWVDRASPLTFDYLYAKLDGSPQCMSFKSEMDIIGAFRPVKQSEEVIP